MSAASGMLENLFRLCGMAKELSARQFYRKLRKNAIRSKKGERICSRFFGIRVEKGVYCGMRYFAFLPREVGTRKSVMYLHGSAYMNGYHIAQISFAAAIARKTQAKVYFPLYPKLPNTTVLPCLALLNNFYAFLKKKGEVLLLGDSSGASLALSLAAEREDVSSVVAISPWLKADLGEAGRKMDGDVMISLSTLDRVAHLWAHDLPHDSVKVSPFYGEYAGKDLLLFAGEKERFRPDISDFFRKQAERGGKVTYREGKGQQHCYPLYPTPEGREARREIYEKLQNTIYGEKK